MTVKETSNKNRACQKGPSHRKVTPTKDRPKGSKIMGGKLNRASPIAVYQKTLIFSRMAFSSTRDFKKKNLKIKIPGY